MPPSAWTILPVLAANAPGKAPFSWPNNSLSMMFAATALQSSVDAAGLWRAGLRAWIARASVSLPVPGSPMISTGRRLRADLAATASADAEFGGGADQLLERQRRRELLGHGRKLARRAAAVGVGGKRFEQAVPARPDEPGNRRRRRASLRPRRRRCRRATGRSPAGRAAARASAAISCGPLVRIPARRAGLPEPRGRAVPGARRRPISSSAAPTTLQPARAAIAEISRRSSGSASISSSERVGSSRIDDWTFRR